MPSVLTASLVLGVVAGLRTFTAPAALYLARGGVAGYGLAVVALGEMVGDMLPQVPSRTSPPALAARMVSGAFVGRMLCAFKGGPPVAGALLGASGALVGAYGGKALRLRSIERIGAVPAALLEDAAAIVLAVAAVR